MNTATEKINKELSNLEPDTIIELFELDFSSLQNHIDMLKLKSQLNIGSEPVYRFHGGKNLSNPIYWQGNGYQPVPIVFEGMESKGDGTLPRPKIGILNIDGLLSRIVSSNDDFVGCIVTRKRTFAKFLDNRNFQNRNLNEDGVNPFGKSDPQAHLPDDIFFINRKVAENKDLIQFELCSALELGSSILPGRIVRSDYCNWKYRCVVGCRYGMDKSSENDGLPRADSNDKVFIGKNGHLSPGESLNVSKTEEIFEWNRYGVKKDGQAWLIGANEDGKRYGYLRGDVVKISPTFSRTQADEVPMVFVCVRGHNDPSEFHPLDSKDVWVRDSCSRTVNGCLLRFGFEADANGEIDTNSPKKPQMIPFGGFPATKKFSSQ
ncbi:MAG: phage minor tail protein L [Actinobacteria bacterium]|nr:phage minor tail protein L [Actinomycetota bacterium]